jgi:hypothetical protein
VKCSNELYKRAINPTANPNPHIITQCLVAYTSDTHSILAKSSDEIIYSRPVQTLLPDAKLIKKTKKPYPEDEELKDRVHWKKHMGNIYGDGRRRTKIHGVSRIH